MRASPSNPERGELEFYYRVELIVKRPTAGRALASSIALLVLSMALLACQTAPIHNVVNAPLRVEEGLSVRDVDEAIWRAGRKLGWEVERLEPGKLRATLRIRRHSATVSINHDLEGFSIHYLSSTNLDQGGNRIHGNYNVWVSRLADKIQDEPIHAVSY